MISRETYLAAERERVLGGLVGATANIISPTLLAIEVVNPGDVSASGWFVGVSEGPVTPDLALPVTSSRMVVPGMQEVGAKGQGLVNLHDDFFRYFFYYKPGDDLVAPNGEIFQAPPTVISISVGKFEVLNILRQQRRSPDPMASQQAIFSLRALLTRANRGQDFSLLEPENAGISGMMDPFRGRVMFGSSRLPTPRLAS